MQDKHPPCDPPSNHQVGRLSSLTASQGVGKGQAWTFAAVEERLVEAMAAWRRAPDGDARYALGGRISSVWRHYAPSARDLASWDMLVEQRAVEPRPLPLSMAEVAAMEEASEWLRFIGEADRRLVVIVLGIMASGEKRVPWSKIKRSMGIPYGADGLRMRYSRAIGRVAASLNAASPPSHMVKPENVSR